MARTQQILLAGAGHIGNDSFTKILLHMDGADASTTCTDSNLGGSAHTWTAAGNAQLDTGIAAKFGTAAGLFDGSGDSFTTPDHADFTLGSGDFTVDFWFNINTGGNGAARLMWGQGNSTANGGFTAFGAMNADNTIYGKVSTDGAVAAATVTSTSTFTTAGWNHYAFVRTGNVLRLFLNGVQEGGDQAYSGTISNSANTFGVGSIGEYVGSLAFNGSIDEFRLSVGIARWTTNFTPSTIAYF